MKEEGLLHKTVNGYIAERCLRFIIDKILESLVSGTRTKATVTSQYLTNTAQQGKCHQASHQQSQLRTAIHLIAHPESSDNGENILH
jgi:hypothetical protein